MKATSRAIGYVRVSTDQQAESGLVEAQEAAIRAAASVSGSRSRAYGWMSGPAESSLSRIAPCCSMPSLR